jgi:hypothetical protein
VSDKVPFDIVGKRGSFSYKFLDFVFAKRAVSGMISLQDNLRRVGFANGNQFNTGREFRFDLLQVFGNCSQVFFSKVIIFGLSWGM